MRSHNFHDSLTSGDQPTSDLPSVLNEQLLSMAEHPLAEEEPDSKDQQETVAQPSDPEANTKAKHEIVLFKKNVDSEFQSLEKGVERYRNMFAEVEHQINSLMHQTASEHDPAHQLEREALHQAEDIAKATITKSLQGEAQYPGYNKQFANLLVQLNSLYTNRLTQINVNLEETKTTDTDMTIKIIEGGVRQPLFTDLNEAAKLHLEMEKVLDKITDSIKQSINTFSNIHYYSKKNLVARLFLEYCDRALREISHQRANFVKEAETQEDQLSSLANQEINQLIKSLTAQSK